MRLWYDDNTELNIISIKFNDCDKIMAYKLHNEELN